MRTAIYRASTGKTRHVHLTECCQGTKSRRTIRVGTKGNWRGQAPDVVTPCVWSLCWNRAHSPQNTSPQERKYLLWVNADCERQSLRRRGYKEASITICEEDGLHEIWD